MGGGLGGECLSLSASARGTPVTAKGGAGRGGVATGRKEKLGLAQIVVDIPLNLMHNLVIG